MTSSESIEMEPSPPSTGTTAVNEEVVAPPVRSVSTTLHRNALPRSSHLWPEPPREPSPERINQRTKFWLARRGKNWAINLETIMSGQTCTPATCKEFLEWLIHVERAPEFLQFLMCVNSYEHTFKNAAESVKSGAPEWSLEDQKATGTAIRKENYRRSTGGILNNVKLALQARSQSVPLSVAGPDVATEGRSIESMNAAEAMVPADKPFRKEVVMIVHTYCLTTSPRELNINPMERKLLEAGLLLTTHPSVFYTLVTIARSSLAQEKIPRFIEYCKDNAGPERRAFAIAVGLFFTIVGFGVLAMLTISDHDPRWRYASMIPLVPGIVTFVMGCCGMCVLLHGFGKFQIKPWELYDEGDVENQSQIKSLDGFMSAVKSDNNAPWVCRHAAVSWIRKIFGKERQIENDRILYLQRKEIFFTTLTSFLVLTVVIAVMMNYVNPHAHSYYTRR